MLLRTVERPFCFAVPEDEDSGRSHICDGRNRRRSLAVNDPDDNNTGRCSLFFLHHADNGGSSGKGREHDGESFHGHNQK